MFLLKKNLFSKDLSFFVFKNSKIFLFIDSFIHVYNLDHIHTKPPLYSP